METVYEEMPSNDDTCRICLDDAGNGEMIAPCLCAGTCKWVHRDCLDKWRVSDSGTNSFNECPQCKFHYKFTRNMETWKYREAMCKFALLMSFELLCMMAVATLVVCVNTIGVMIYMGNYLCFNYFVNTLPMGIFVTLVVTGITTILVYLCTPSTTSTTSTGPDINIFNFGDRSCCRRRRRCRKDDNDRCDSCSGGGDSGKDLLMAIAVVLAVIGLVVIIAFAFMFIVEKGRLHWQSSWRGRIVDEYVVKHLDKHDNIV